MSHPRVTARHLSLMVWSSERCCRAAQRCLQASAPMLFWLRTRTSNHGEASNVLVKNIITIAMVTVSQAFRMWFTTTAIYHHYKTFANTNAYKQKIDNANK